LTRQRRTSTRQRPSLAVACRSAAGQADDTKRSSALRLRERVWRPAAGVDARPTTPPPTCYTGWRMVFDHPAPRTSCLPTGREATAVIPCLRFRSSWRYPHTN
jgi:hypothetical protein